MTTITNPVLPQGGINSGDTVYIVGYPIPQSVPYVVCLSGSSGLILNPVFQSFAITDTNIPLLDPSTVPLPFQVTNAGNTVVFSTNGKVIIYDSAGNISLASPISGQSITLSQTFYQGLPAPAILISGISYTATGSGISLTISQNGTTTPYMRSWFILPTLYFANCSANETNIPINNLTNLFGMNYCSQFKNIGAAAWCTTSQMSTVVGWSDEPDCINNFVFNYCPTSVVCTGNCVSSCEPGSICTFDSTSMTYSCQPQLVIIQPPLAPVTPVQTPGSVFTQPWFIIAVVVVIIVIICIVVAITGRRNKPVNQTVNTQNAYTTWPVVPQQQYYG